MLFFLANQQFLRPSGDVDPETVYGLLICPRKIVLLLFPNCYKLISLRSSRVCEPIYTVKNLYNDFIILQEFFLRKKVRVYVVYVDISIIYKLQ